MHDKASDNATHATSMTPLDRPSLSWRMSSSFVMGATAMVARGFLYGLNTVEISGMDRFLQILDRRKDVNQRERGLITVCNHVSVMDDPLLWGILPMRYAFDPTNLRWGLGAHDICFKNKAFATFFGLGQVLPTHRQMHSPHGGPFQPTIPQAIRLLSAQPFAGHQPGSDTLGTSSTWHDISDPFTTGGGLTYTTTGTDSFMAPSTYAQNRLAWIHIFPEGCIHQHPSLTLRYFKWGIARLILEAEPMPDVLPMFIDGTQHIMSEERTFPRFLPRGGQKFHVAFGELLDTEAVFGDLRAKWQELVRRDRLRRDAQTVIPLESRSRWWSISSLWPTRPEREAGAAIVKESLPGATEGAETTLTTTRSEKEVARPLALGELSDELKYGQEAQALRIEVARRVRDEVEKLRVSLGYPEDDPKLGLAETWAREPAMRAYKSNVDESLVRKE